MVEASRQWLLRESTVDRYTFEETFRTDRNFIGKFQMRSFKISRKLLASRSSTIRKQRPASRITFHEHFSHVD